MMYKCIIFILIAGLAVAQNDYDFKILREQIDEKCLNLLWTNHRGGLYPSGQTMESFISMVELVEGNNTDWNIYQVSRALVKRFAFEGIEFTILANKRAPVQSDDAKERWTVARKLVGEDPSDIQFKEDNLSETDKCTMFFMMGHLVNSTFREGYDQNAHQTDTILDPSSGGLQKASGKTTDKPREQGVVNVNGSPHQAIAISTVLNAILASQTNTDKPVHELYNIDIKGFPQDKRISPLVGITLGEVLTRASLRKEGHRDGLRYFGPGGFWNSTTCPTEYELHENVTKGATNALLRGAVDGLLIGNALREGLSSVQGLRLSHLLRMYYSPKGLPKPNNNEQGQGYSYCRREEAAGIASQAESRESILAYYYVYTTLLHNQVLEGIPEIVDSAFAQLGIAIGALSGDTASEECKERAPVANQPTCETPSNVLIVLDSSERQTDGYAEQEDVVGLLATRFDFGSGSGTLSVFQDAVQNNELRRVSYNSTNPTCAACKTAWIDQKSLNRPDSEVQIMDALNSTLKNFEMATHQEPGVPNKVVVLFHFDDLKEQKGRLQAAGNMLREGHRDTRIFAVGKDKNGLSPLVNGDTNVITDISNAELLTKELTKRICKVPAILQFHRCHDHSKNREENKNVYTGYVTDDHVQFWAFYPEYYLKSYDIKIKFRVESGDIYVCQQRAFDNPGYSNGNIQREKCSKTDPGKREITFNFKNPCENYHVHNCPTINFAIIGEGKGPRTLSCPDRDNRCRRFDQIKFQVSHEGISCNDCEFLKASPIVLLIVSIFFYIKN